MKTVLKSLHTIHYLPKYDMTNYSWGFVEALSMLKDKPIKGIVIGGGPGIEKLRQNAIYHGVEDKIIFMGKIPFEKMPSYINLIDVCLLTQPRHETTDARTTAKLPEYLACGKFVITSYYYEASKVIKDNGFVLNYNGFKDLEYPARLAEKLKFILGNISILTKGLKGVEVAKEMYDYKILGKRLETIMSNNQ